MMNRKLKNLARRVTALLLAAMTVLPVGMLTRPAKAAITTTNTKIVVWDWVDDVQSLGQDGIDYHTANENKNIAYRDTKYSRILFYYPDGGERYYCNVSPWTGLEDDGQGYDEWSTFHPQQVFLDAESRIGSSANREWNDDLIAAETAAIQAGYTGNADAFARSILGDLANYNYSQRVSANKSDPKSFVTMGGLRTPYVSYAEKYDKSASKDHTWRLWAAEKDDSCSAFAICLTNDYEDLDVRHTYGGFANMATYDRKKEKDQRIDGWVIDNHFIYANSANHRGEFANPIGPNICFWHWDNDSGAANEALYFSPSGRRFYAPNVPTLVTTPDRYYSFLGKEYKIGQLGADFTVEADQNQTLGKPLYYIPEGRTITVARDGVLIVDGMLLNDGKIVVEDGGLLIVKDGAGVLPFTKFNGNCGAVTSYGTVIVENNALLCGGGMNGLKLLGGVVVNFGVLAGECLTVSRNFAIDNRDTGWVIAGHSPTSATRNKLIQAAIADRELDFSDPESYFGKVGNFDSYYSMPANGVYGNTANVLKYVEPAVGTPSDPLLSVYTREDLTKQYAPLFMDEPVDNVSMTATANGVTYRVGNTEYKVENKLVAAYIGRGAGKRETIFKDKWAGADGNKYVILSPTHAPNMSLDLVGNGKSSGTNVQIYTTLDTDANLWRLVERGTGTYKGQTLPYYTIESWYAPGKALDTTGTTANGTVPHLWDTNANNQNQLWFLVPEGSFYRIVPKTNTNSNLGCPGGGTTNNTPVIFYDQIAYSGQPHDQVWSVVSNTLNETVFSNAVDVGTAVEFVPEYGLDLRLTVNGDGVSTAAGDGAARWRLEPAGTDNLDGEIRTFYTIVEKNTGKALAVRGNTFEEVTQLAAVAPGGSEMQHWYVKDLPGGQYSQIVARGNTEYVLTGDARTTGGSVTLRSNANAATQHWEVKGVRGTAEETANISDPYHNATFTLAPKHAPTMNIGVQNNGKDNGAAVQLQAAVASSLAQQWTLKRLGTADLNGAERAYYAIENVNSGKALDCNGGASGAQTHIWNTDPTNVDQHWFLVPADDGAFTLVPRQNPAVCLDVKGGARTAGTAIQLYNNNGGNNQKWVLTAAVDETDLGGKVVTLTPSHAQNMSLDFAQYNKANGTKMVIYHSIEHESQRWKLVKRGTAFVNGRRQSYYTIESCYATGSALDTSGSTANGARPTIYTLGDDNRNRLWFVLPTGDGNYYIVPRGDTTKALTVASAAKTDNSIVTLYDNNSAAEQKWKLTEVTEPTVLGTFEIQPVAAPNFSVDVQVPGNVYLWGTHNGNYTRWQFVKMGVDDHGPYYKIVNQGEGRALDVSGTAANNSQTILYDFEAGGEQFWYLDYLGEDALGEYYNITLRSNDKLRLGVQNSAYRNGTSITTTTERGKNTQFRLVAQVEAASLGVYEFSYAAIPDARMEIEGESTASGAQVRIWTNVSKGHQQWKIVLRGYTLKKGVKTPYVSIENVNSGKVLDLSGTGEAAAVNMGNVTQYDYDGYSDQQWFIEPQSNGTVKFRNRANEKLYLDGNGGGGSKVVVAGDSNETYKRWQLHPVAQWGEGGRFYIPAYPAGVEAGIPTAFNEDFVISYIANGMYTLTPQHNTGVRLDLRGGVQDNGQDIWAYDNNGAYSQKWIITPIGVDFFDGDGSGHVYYKIVYSLNNNKAVNTDGSVSYSAGLRYNIHDYEGCYDNFFYLEPVSDSKSSDAYNLITRGTLKSGGICVEVPDNGGSGTVLKTAALNKNAKNQQWTLTQTS